MGPGDELSRRDPRGEGGRFMTIDRTMSKKTWEKIDELLWKIHRRAERASDLDTLKESDQANALLRNLAGEILMEDERRAAIIMPGRT